MRKISKLCIFFFLLPHCGSENLNVTRTLRKNVPINFQANHIFIAPHPDDWQLFMGEYAFDLIKSPSTKVTLLLTNAGDAAKGTAYWQARELAGIASVRAVLGYPLLEGDASETDETLSLNGKSIRHHVLKNVSMYFLRLPDGFPDGSGSSEFHYNTMLKLLRGEISSLQSVDGSNTFTWNELQNLSKAIIDRELANPQSPVTFYFQDPGSEKLFSHSDHLATQALARSLTPFYDSEQCKQIAFEDYRIKTKTQNISKDLVGKKSFLFSAYDLVMIQKMGECNMCILSHYQWLSRSYHREFNCAS